MLWNYIHEPYQYHFIYGPTVRIWGFWASGFPAICFIVKFYAILFGAGIFGRWPFKYAAFLLYLSQKQCLTPAKNMLISQFFHFVPTQILPQFPPEYSPAFQWYGCTWYCHEHSSGSKSRKYRLQSRNLYDQCRLDEQV